jgi:hypothetical protein
LRKFTFGFETYYTHFFLRRRDIYFVWYLRFFIHNCVNNILFVFAFVYWCPTFCSIICIYPLSSVLWCPHNNDDIYSHLFVRWLISYFLFVCKMADILCPICVCLCIDEPNKSWQIHMIEQNVGHQYTKANTNKILLTQLCMKKRRYQS